MKKRLVSLLLAFSMMLTFLPVGAVSAFAAGDDEIGEATETPTPGHLIAPEVSEEANWVTYIREPGTYYLSGNYNRKIGIETTDEDAAVTIKIVGPVTITPITSTESVFIEVKKVGSLKIENTDNYTVESSNTGSAVTMLLSYASNSTTTVDEGNYKNCGFNFFSGKVLFNNVNAESVSSIISAYGSDVTLNNGSYTGKPETGNNYPPTILNAANGDTEGCMTVNSAVIKSDRYAYEAPAIKNVNSTLIVNADTQITSAGHCIFSEGARASAEINGGNFTGTEAFPVIYNNGYYGGGKLQIHGGTFTGYNDIVYNSGEKMVVDEEAGKTILISNGGKTGASSSGVRCLGTGKTEVNGGTIVNADYGIWVEQGTPDVILKKAEIVGETGDVYLGTNQKITIDDAYTKEVTVKCVDPKDLRQITNTTTGTNQKELNIKLLDEGYLAGYKKNDDGSEYRYLQAPHTVTAVNATATADVGTGDGVKTLTSADYVPTSTTVTAEASPLVQGKKFTGKWKLTVDGVESDELTMVGEADSEGHNTKVSFTVPADSKSIVIEAVYEGVEYPPKDTDEDEDKTPTVNTDHQLTVTGGTFTVKKDDADVTVEVTNDKTTGKQTCFVPDGAEVTVKLDKTMIPESMVFDIWSTGKFDLPLGQDYKAETITFTMSRDVDVTAQYRDASIDDDDPDIIGPIIIGGTIAAGGAVLGYQTYSLATGFLGDLWGLPYFPSNRSALAMMLWEDAGEPMPESDILYPDVGWEEQDMDLQHAARWAMEHELIPDKNDKDADLTPEEVKFFPDDPVSKYSVLKAWKKAQELKKNS